jgi:hypothetical protein
LIEALAFERHKFEETYPMQNDPTLTRAQDLERTHAAVSSLLSRLPVPAAAPTEQADLLARDRSVLEQILAAAALAPAASEAEQRHAVERIEEIAGNARRAGVALWTSPAAIAGAAALPPADGLKH